MRCLIVVPSLKRAGAETQAVDLANGLSDMGHTVHLASFEPQLDQATRINRNVTFHHVIRKNKYDISLPRRLAEVIDNQSIDVIQGVLQFATLVAWGALMHSRRKPALVAAVHTTINQSLKAELHDRLLYRRMLRRRPAVVFVCRFQKDYWIKRYPELESNSHVIYNGVDPSLFRREQHIEEGQRLRGELAIPEGAFVFSCLAAFRPEKAHELLIDAFCGLPSRTHLILAGDGERRGLIEERVRAANVHERVRFLGSVADVRPVIAASSATILTSTAVETFSMAMLESMALGVPMIAPNIGGLPEAIVPGETGLLFPVGNVQALAQGMRALTEDCEALERMGSAAAAKVHGEFTLRRMLEDSERVLLQAARVEL